jgi:signal recognition particle GTPase
MSIIVVDFNVVKKDIKNLKKSKNIICPECNENIRIRIYGQKIFLYECKNKHKKNDLLLTQFEKTQYIDESKIICNVCKNNKNDVYGNKFYICVNCKFKLCPLCKNSHDKSHNIIDYDEKNYICATHFESYTSYCYDCKKDICTVCEKEHSSHKSITYGSILPDMEKVNNELKNLNQKINEYKNEINKIIEKLKNNLINLDIYYKISYDIINNYENKKRNYPILQNINDINDFMKI